jgi:tyrosyl-tRNA synthetase
MDAPVMTYQPKSDFLRVMIERGFLADCTDMQGFDDALMSGVVPGYIGFDATARSLHVGSLIQIMTLRWLQKTGHKPITLMGGGTTKVGDPSFRADERPLLTAATSTRTSRASRRSSRSISTTATAPPAR